MTEASGAQGSDGRLIGVFGAAGFGREVMPLLRKQYAAAEPQAQFVFVERSAAPDQNGVPVMAETEFLASPRAKAFVLAIADGEIRARLHDMALRSGAVPLEARAASAEVFDRATLRAGAILCAQSIVSSDVQVGLCFHLNVFSYLAHDCRVGDFVTFGPHVTCAGNVIIEDRAYIGAGALIRQGTPDKPLVIGAGAVIGMGAVVTKDVPPGVTVVGNPARPLEQR
ncbi:acetyltransferase [Cypionkella sp.]|uniref:acetyltransferase n=1 Tax=Cypionkella sp. TaxID=2811411 RepID=UPI0027202FF9|nr:acetyltransferase [Cypionkella sp.]MDO8982381.1 acetyltransferase [Cypionkella sp.]MDP1577084.1 acetyltransferase [Cypionkella sp.]MDP2050631.1 acetyltransferase [Cypionkella sp.]